MADKSTRFEMRAPADWVRLIDDWRRKQADIPSRAEAIRRLAARGLVLDRLGYDGRVEHSDLGVGALLSVDELRPDEAMVNFDSSDLGERAIVVPLDELSAHRQG